MLVLKNILRQILYPKGGDSTYLWDDSPIVLDCFGKEFTKFSVSRYIWYKIYHASEDVVKHFPYAPYIMHVIDQVFDIKFPIGAPHVVLKTSNKTSLKARDELRDAATASHASGAYSHASPLAASRSSHAASEEAPSSCSCKKPPSKFKFFMKYMFGACCASAQCEQEMLVRIHHIEQKLDIQSDASPPLVLLLDPFELYDEACMEYYGEKDARRKGKQRRDDEDEEYHEEDDDGDDDDDDDDDHDDDKDYKDE